MTAPRAIPDAVLQKQIEASDPAASTWVSANAGSGKTYVLAQRVIRLLLDGVDPAKILCITFTKAAAANMANQVFRTLRVWTTLDDAELDAAIRATSNVKPDAKVRNFARRLFALALETPGGLKVQTIHAFCTRLLHQFPFEANVAARFTVLDDPAQAQLLEQSSLGVLLEAAQAPESARGRALATAIASAADQTFKDVVNEAIRKRDLVRQWTERAGGVDAAIAELCETLKIDPDDSLEHVEAEILDSPLLPPKFWPRAAEIFAAGSANDKKQAERFAAAIAASGAARVEAYLDIFLTGTETARRSLITKTLADNHPEFERRLVEEQAQVLLLIERRKAVACRARTAALLTIADAVIARYQDAKDRRGLLDYDDLIEKTLAMLDRGAASWVHYKLDRGIDHVLIDEAQDTSPRQWQIIHSLVHEFFAGAGARSIKRTIFAVGDEKQSIFSFQGAAPQKFDAMRREFENLSKAAGMEFRSVRLNHSFRSGAIVLEGVDRVFERPEAFNGLSADNVKTVHEALPDKAPGLVEIWDTIKPDERREIEAWDAPFDETTETSPQVRLAEKIARNVQQWTTQGARAGDVLVLVRQRGALFEPIIRALKDARIAVAGADRLVLTEHIAVMDLMVLADALLLPDDDLALATVLKSPLFGFDDDDLFAIAWQREGSLREALRAKAPAQPRFADAEAMLRRFAECARLETPFAFFARVLGPERGRKKFLARLGPEADDALDEFLNVALDYESRETPSLQGFLAWLRTARTDVKRDMEITRDEVRVMTVHGAKGLEAPIVILADTTTPPSGPSQRQPRLVALAAEGAATAAGQFVWAAARTSDIAVVSTAREVALGETENEYRRLLYVAMTRAIDRLVVCGYDGERARPEGCWYNLVHTALVTLSVEEASDDGDGTVWRYRKSPSPADTGAAERLDTFDASSRDRPAWLDRDAVPESATVVPLSPSNAYDETALVRRTAVTGAERKQALARGDLVHRLLQSLPDIPAAARAEAARRHVARTAAGFTSEECEELIAQVQGVLDDARFAELFAPGSRAEVPIVGRLVRAGRTVAVAGQIDRLVVTPAAVLIADYKTNRPAPRALDDVPPPYVTQLALYRAVLAELYPDKAVRAALLWTGVPDLMELSAPALDAALAAVKLP
jgi:ATP-dependent helicase/nuclease subunit A